MKSVLTALIATLAAAGTLFAAPQTRTIVVFPFENQSSSASVDWLSDGFSEMLSVRMSGPSRLVIGRAERNKACQQLSIPSDRVLTLASEYEVAQTLGVDWAVVGSFKVTGREITAEAQLLDVEHLKLYPPLEETGDLSSLMAVASRLVWRLLAGHDPDFTSDSEQNFEARFPPVRLDAFERYIRGTLAPDGPMKVQFLTTASQLDPTNHRAAYALGQYYFEEKDYADSVHWLALMDAKDSDFLSSLFLSGVDNFFLGHDQEAQRDFEQLSATMPLNEVWNNLGVLAARRADYTAALKDFTRADHGDPSDAVYDFNLGACYVDLGEYSSATKYLKQAETQSPDDLGVRALLAYALGKSGDQGGSRAELDWVASHDGKSMASLSDGILPQPRIKKQYNGAAFQLLYAAVHNSIEAVLEKEPPAEHGRYHLERGEDLVTQKRLPEAIRELSEAEKLIPQNDAVHLFLGQAYEMEGQHQRAIEELKTALTLSNNAITHLWLADAYFSSHQTAEALAEGQAALALDPGNSGAQRLIDSIEQRQKDVRQQP